ncbi:hypothetical protein [Streptomyces litchfieldiae]|uniref:Uncharacterized protein n=1 Tax=Streptomyces litchfieldiae TaxID=3075543 RepID=A0ABU2MV61_9ACTN|nr:hypothetical protein [Streptomyces sp. DSM 44938]MDT0345532.1 hypothetical protein [Streptomyces sp. DSM 44938]
MPRRVSLPAADELFRSTGGAAVQPSTPPESATGTAEGPAATRVPAPGGDQSAAPGEETEGGRRAAGSPEEARTGRTPGGGREAAVPGQPKRDQAARPAQTGAAKGGRANNNNTAAGAQRRGRSARRPSGRERHDEKITVYVSAEELMDLEHARLVLRGEHGLAVDRGRIVREAVAVVLADLESRGDASILVRRLRGR